VRFLTQVGRQSENYVYCQNMNTVVSSSTGMHKTTTVCGHPISPC